jgi:hypothetical protein
MPAAIDLPHDIEALRSLLIQQSSALAERNTQLQVAEATVLSQKLELEKLRLQIACLK